MARKDKKQKSVKSSTLIEKKVADILSSMQVSFKQEVTIGKYTVDFLVNDTYIIECYGDFWHCNPEKYSSDYFNKGKRKTAKEIWERDLDRRKTFESMGYKFLSLWESEINKNSKNVRQKIKRMVKQKRREIWLQK